MTEPEAEYSERLRRALHAAADGVVPSRDGLERIRHRIAHEQSRDSFALLLGWLKSVVMDCRFLIADLRSATPPIRPIARAGKLRAMRVLAPVAALVSAAVAALAPAARSAAMTVVPAARTAAAAVLRAAVPALRSAGRTIRSASSAVRTAIPVVKSIVPERLRANDGWLRPVLATAGAVLVAIVMILAIPGLRQNIMQTSNESPRTGQSPPGGAPGTDGASPGVSARQGTSVSASPSASSSPKRGSRTPAPCPTSWVLSPSAASTSTCPPITPPAGIPTASPSPSPTLSPSPTDTASPSPSPSGTASSNSPGGPPASSGEATD